MSIFRQKKKKKKNTGTALILNHETVMIFQYL